MSPGKIDIFGGTFDPVQPGHVELIKKSLHPDRALLLAPTTQNPWKARQATPMALRLEMLRLVLKAEGIEFVETEPMPGRVFLCQEPYERSVELLRHCRAHYGGDIRWLVGPGDKDSAKNWFRWAEEGCEVIELPSSYPHHSTDVREGRVEPHPALAKFIDEHELYRSGE